MRQGEWIRRRWTDIRNGIDHYIAKLVAFASFVLLIRLTYPELFPYTVFITLGLIFLAAFTGYLHRRFQWGTDNNSAFEQAPLQAKVQWILFKAVVGKATSDEIDWAVGLLKSIAEGKT